MRLPGRLVLLLVTATATVPTGAAPPEVEAIRAAIPEALIPGCVTPVFDRNPSGYLVCSLLCRHFDDETATDLQPELDLAARMQLVRCIGIGRQDGSARARVTLHGIHTVGVWWEDDALCGLYFVPSAETGGALDGALSAADAVNRHPVVAGPSAAELLLEARASRKRGAFSIARDALGRLREEYPTSPEARRALRELFLVNTEEGRRRTALGESP